MSCSLIQAECTPEWNGCSCKITTSSRQKHSISLCLPFLPSILSSVSPYYFEKVGAILRVESNPSWRIIKAAAAPTLALFALERNRRRRHRGSYRCLYGTLDVWPFSSGLTQTRSLFISFKSKPLTKRRSTGTAVYVWGCQKIRFSCIKLEKLNKGNICESASRGMTSVSLSIRLCKASANMNEYSWSPGSWYKSKCFVDFYKCFNIVIIWLICTLVHKIYKSIKQITMNFTQH